MKEENKKQIKSKKYLIEQFPKNKDIINLSDEQKDIRKNQKKFIYKDKFTCIKCLKEMPIKEFYVADKKTGRRKRSCRDCQMKDANIVEIGKVRFSKKILDKGFRRCCTCKNIKPINEYQTNEKTFGGHTHTCKDCNYNLSSNFIKLQREKIGLFHIKQYGKQKYGIIEFDENIITKLKNEIIESRKPKFFLDGKEFLTLADFARYILDEYGLPITMTTKRISQGKTEEQCKLSESKMRSNAYYERIAKQQTNP